MLLTYNKKIYILIKKLIALVKNLYQKSLSEIFRKSKMTKFLLIFTSFMIDGDILYKAQNYFSFSTRQMGAHSIKLCKKCFVLTEVCSFPSSCCRGFDESPYFIRSRFHKRLPNALESQTLSESNQNVPDVAYRVNILQCSCTVVINNVSPLL